MTGLSRLYSSLFIQTRLLETIIAALATSPPTRALLSAGWGGFGGVDIPENVFILGNVPHDWLFEKVL